MLSSTVKHFAVLFINHMFDTVQSSNVVLQDQQTEKNRSHKPGTGSQVAVVHTSSHNGGCHLWPHTPKHCSGDRLSLQLTNQPPKSPCPFGQPHFLYWKQAITPSQTHCQLQHPAENEAQHQPPSSPFFIVLSSCCTFFLTPCCCPLSANPQPPTPPQSLFRAN